MKTYEVKPWDLINASSTIPKSIVSLGIPINPHHGRDMVMCGQPRNGLVGNCKLALPEFAPDIVNGKIFSGEIHWSGKTPFIVSGNKKDSPNLMVKVTTCNMRNIPLCISSKTGGPQGGVEVLSFGNGTTPVGNKQYNDWDQGLFIIKPHCAVIIEKQGKPYLAVVNSGGLVPQVLVINYQEYTENFQPNLNATKRPAPTKRLTVNPPHDSIFAGLGEFGGGDTRVRV